MAVHETGRSARGVTLALAAAALLAGYPSQAAATTVQNTVNPGTVAAAVAGSGVQVNTATVATTAGNPQLSAVGTFSGAPAALGFTDGVGLTTGSLQSLLTLSDSGYQSAVWSVDLPDIPIDSDYATANPSTPASADLVRLTLGITPVGSTLHVKYLFASEEFDQMTPRNDGALILVDSPATGGPADKNCALLPGGAATFVANVNQSATYFRTDSAGALTSLNGSTTQMECDVPVVAGQPATVRFVAFDATDGAADSALLLGADSLTSEAAPSGQQPPQQGITASPSPSSQAPASTSCRKGSKPKLVKGKRKCVRKKRK